MRKPASSAAAWLSRWGPVILVMIAIFYFSSRTGDDLNGWLPLFRKLIPGMAGFDWGHFVAYFILGLAFLWALTTGAYTVKEKLLAVLLCVLYGLTDEFHQQFVPGRSPDWHDLRNDGIGALLAMLVVSLPRVHRLAVHLKSSSRSRFRRGRNSQAPGRRE
ncbi:VanZ family protein [Gorillibacterium sp. sgz500922]|uniref:VanZ family protein n=1 Tax=Gorillibacterium sp. sgz500922 TaxID=3446694 RepID=UPI003F673261